MREIKFRAWDKENKEIVEVELLGKKVLLYKNGWENIENFEVMQYTGLKDKNGKEIYEGDIFKAKHSGRFEYIGHVYHEDCFGFKIMNYPVFGWPEYKNYTFWIKEFIEHFPLEHVEVIGNTFENPELLEESE